MATKVKPPPKGSSKSGAWKYFSAPYKCQEGVFLCCQPALPCLTHPLGKYLGKDVVQCLVPEADGEGWCGDVLLYYTSTTAMNNHLNLKHTRFMAQEKGKV